MNKTTALKMLTGPPQKLESKQSSTAINSSRKQKLDSCDEQLKKSPKIMRACEYDIDDDDFEF